MENNKEKNPEGIFRGYCQACCSQIEQQEDQEKELLLQEELSELSEEKHFPSENVSDYGFDHYWELYS